MEPFTPIPNWLIEAMPQMPASVLQEGRSLWR
jgi:hypothetical protein